MITGPRFASILLKAQKDFSINPVSLKGISHFHIACSCKEVAAVEEFLKHGADINLPINYFCEFYGGLTPLHLAAVHHPKDIFIFLGKRRIDVEYAIHYILQIQEDPFYVACIEDYKKTVDILLQHGANPNTVDRSGNNSVHVAVTSKTSQMDIWKRLIRFVFFSYFRIIIRSDDLTCNIKLNSIRAFSITVACLMLFIGQGQI